MSPVEALLAACLAVMLVSLAEGLAITSARPETANLTATTTADNIGDDIAANLTADTDVDDLGDYYPGYDYSDLDNVNVSQNDLSEVEPGVIPEPSTLDDDEVDEGEVVAGGDVRRKQLGRDVDPDLHDHDTIDSVMYIYFGSQQQQQRLREQRAHTSWRVVVFGAASSLVAQLLALGAAVRRLRAQPRDCSAAILLNTEVALALASVVFLVGIQATRSRQCCEAVSLVLHYLYLVACCWLLTVSVHVLQRLRRQCSQLLQLACPLAWLVPAIIVLGCYLLNPHGYETQRYCWMSVEKGMLLSYLMPVAPLIMANTAVSLASVRELTRCEMQEKPLAACVSGGGAEDSGSVASGCGCGGGDDDDSECRELSAGRLALRRCASLLPLLAVAWFLGVVALENPQAVALAIMYAATSAFLNWFLFASSATVLSACEPPPPLPPAAAPGPAVGLRLSRESLDCQPLLGAEWGPPPPPHAARGGRQLPPPQVLTARRGELLEMSLDCISTISA